MSAGKTLRALAGHVRRGRHSTLPAIAIAGVFLLSPGSAFSDVPVHVTPSNSAPDTCAICHRAHTSNAPLTYRGQTGPEPLGSALTLTETPERGDVGLCYTCHGIAALGASVDVETSFTVLPSVHKIAPAASVYGPSPKMCGACHDPHGTDRIAGGAPYPKLLRVWTSASTTVTSGEEYCDACHQGRNVDGGRYSRYAALATYKQTTHYTKLPDPVSGTRIRCSNCHVAHGSPIAPLIAGLITRPGASTPTSMTANDRTLCTACHENEQATWAGEVAFDGSSHAESTKKVPVLGEWAPVTATRYAGECQVCHAPMGRTGAGGVAIPKLAEKPGRQLCDTCHKAGGTAAKNLASLAYPAGESTRTELVAVYGATPVTAAFARVSVYGRDPADHTALLGPREYALPSAGAVAASGDVDGDGAAELVVARPSEGKLTVYQRDTRLGLTTSGAWNVTIPDGLRADFIAIGRFVGSPDRDQIAVLDAAARTLGVFTLGDAALTWSHTFAGGTPSGLASGEVTGTPTLSDLVVTDSTTPRLHIFWQAAPGPVSMDTTSVAALLGARGPSIGDAWLPTAGNEIVVCNPGEFPATVSVFDSSGFKLEEVVTDGTPDGALPYASTVADVLWGDGRPEVCVAVYSLGAINRVNLFTQNAGGLDAVPVARDTGPMYGSASITAGDLDGDTYPELVVGNGGSWDAAGGMQGPSVQVLNSAFGDWLTTGTSEKVGGGTELAGTAPALVIADFGGIVPSRHPIDEVASAKHVSTETAGFDRHVTCADCHNPHEANSTAPTAPENESGRMAGAWGISAGGLFDSPLPAPSRAFRQYEVCFKCHSGYPTAPAARTNIASLVDTRNAAPASVHAIEAPSAVSNARPATFVGTWTNSSYLRCTDCHGNAAPGEAIGPHRSTAAPLLVSPALGIGPGDGSGLCYDCHVYNVYRKALLADATPEDSSNGSYFWSGDFGSLHERHSGAFTGVATGLEISCLACHVSHGSAEPHLLRSDIGFEDGALGGTCTELCHLGDPQSYP